jgi:LEA14-like dessication related protein
MAGFLLWGSGCATLGGLVEKPKVTLTNVEITQASFQGLDAIFQFAVENPNAIGIDLARLDYRLTIDGQKVIEGHGDKPLQVPAHGNGTLALPVSIQFYELGRAVAAVLTRPELPYAIKATLGFNSPIGTIEVPIEQSGTFPVPRVPQFSLRGARLEGLSLGGVTVHVELGAKNPNSFELPTGAFDYRVRVEGTEVASGATSPGKLAPGETQPVLLACRIEFLRTGVAVAEALGSGAANVAVEGQLDLGAFKVPVSVSERVSLR